MDALQWLCAPLELLCTPLGKITPWLSRSFRSFLGADCQARDPPRNISPWDQQLGALFKQHLDVHPTYVSLGVCVCGVVMWCNLCMYIMTYCVLCYTSIVICYGILCNIMLCCVILGYNMICYDTLGYVMLSYDTIWHLMLYWVVLCYMLLYYVIVCISYHVMSYYDVYIYIHQWALGSYSKGSYSEMN